MYYVLLSGGSGKRLWPLSNEARPKQYLKVVNKEMNSMERCSMLQRVWDQMKEAGISSRAVITAGGDQTELIKSQVKEARIAVEPGRRDTFAAVLLSCSWLYTKLGAGKEDYAAIMPVDPYTEGSYFETVKSLEEVMELFPRLQERINQQAGTLSGGEQQMLAIGRALMAKPKLLCLDEPSLGLAPIIINEVFRKITQINKELGQTILLVEQNAYLALEVSHRAYVMKTGTIIREGISSELLNDPAIQEDYLGKA